MTINEKKEKKRSTYFSHFKHVRFQTFECLHKHEYYVLCFQLLRVCTKPTDLEPMIQLPILVLYTKHFFSLVVPDFCYHTSTGSTPIHIGACCQKPIVYNHDQVSQVRVQLSPLTLQHCHPSASHLPLSVNAFRLPNKRFVRNRSLLWEQPTGRAKCQ